MPELSQYEGLRKKPHKKGPMAIPQKQWKMQQRLRSLGRAAQKSAVPVATTATYIAGALQGHETQPETPPAIIETAETKTEQPSITVETVKQKYTDLLTKNPKEQKEARELIAKQREIVMRIVTEPGTTHESTHLKVVQRWREKIIEEAVKNNIPPQIALAVALIENSGGPAKVSEKGAVGIFQLMEKAATEMGLAIQKNENGEIVYDEREIPAKNIEAGLRYLALQRDRFGGSVGLALLAYYEGPQAVLEQVNHGYVSSESSFDDSTTREILAYYIAQNDISAYSLGDDKYVPRVIAAAEHIIAENIIEPEKMLVTIPNLPHAQKPRTDGAVI